MSTAIMENKVLIGIRLYYITAIKMCCKNKAVIKDRLLLGFGMRCHCCGEQALKWVDLVYNIKLVLNYAIMVDHYRVDFYNIHWKLYQVGIEGNTRTRNC